MKLTLILLLTCSLTAFSQTLADFENFDLPPESFLNGSDGSDNFTSGNVLLPNEYDPGSDSWFGWSISNTTDTETPGFTNQYSAITGGGAESTETYAVSYTADTPVTLDLIGAAQGEAVRGFYVTNSTYAYRSMLDGDSFAKRFGGVTGNDADFFLLTVRKILNGIISEESIEIYLADYRFADNAQDYILTDWQYVDVRDLGEADALQFTLTSTDNGVFGMNTPAYFCLDELLTSDGISGVGELSREISVSIFPNPASDYLHLQTESPAAVSYRIFAVHGTYISQGEFLHSVDISLQTLPAGQYFLQFENEDVFDYRRFSVVKAEGY